MRKFSKSTVFTAKWSAASLVLAAAIAACGGGNTTPDLVAAADTKVAVNASTVAAILPSAGGTPFTATFPNGFSGVDATGKAVAITGSTQVAFTGTAAAPKFSLTKGGTTATGDVVFGSCSFKITNISGGILSEGFDVGWVIKVDPCSINVATAGATANGEMVDRTIKYVFGDSESSGFSVSVSISPNGTLTLRPFAGSDTILTTIPVVPLSGGI